MTGGGLRRLRHACFARGYRLVVCADRDRPELGFVDEACHRHRVVTGPGGGAVHARLGWAARDRPRLASRCRLRPGDRAGGGGWLRRGRGGGERPRRAHPRRPGASPPERGDLVALGRASRACVGARAVAVAGHQCRVAPGGGGRRGGARDRSTGADGIRARPADRRLTAGPRLVAPWLQRRGRPDDRRAAVKGPGQTETARRLGADVGGLLEPAAWSGRAESAGFAVHGVALLARAELHQLEPVGVVATVLLGDVVALLALRARQGDLGADVE